MYVPEFVCGIVFTILVEIAIAMVCAINSSNKENTEGKYDEETDYRDKKGEQRND